MKRKNIVGISLIMVLLIVISSFAANSMIPRSEDEFAVGDLYPNNSMKPTTEVSTIEVDKKIWSGTAWVDTINADIFDIVQFNITITYHEDCGYKATKILVNDTLPPCLEYSGGAVIVHGDNTFTGESENSGNFIIWNLTGDYGIELWDTNQYPSKPPRTVYIEFLATVIDFTDNDGENNTVDVTAMETCCHQPLEGHDEATVIITETMPTIEVTKTASPEEIAEPGGLITFTVEVQNTGVETVTLTSLVDDIYGDLNGMGDCFLPQVIAAGNTYTCSFQATVTGNAGDSETDTVTALAEDGEGNPASDSDSATVIITDGGCKPGIDVTKFVRWDCCGEFEKYITFDINNYDYVVFKLYVNNTGEITLNISVKDILPLGLSYHIDFSYVDGHHQEPEISGNCLFWNFTDVLPGTSIVITFRADVDDCGGYINLANVTGEYDCQEKIYDEDTATVVVYGCEFEEPLLEKKVWNESSDQWEESITAEIGDTVRFNITVSYVGENVLYNINITDTLPDCLKYDNNADPVESGISDNVIFWNLTGLVLQDGQSYSIEFDAEVISYGININVANIVADECSGEIWCDQDTAIVNVYEPSLLEKKVWNESSDQWEESITAEIGDTVRFNITVSYYGTHILYNINVADTLPECLEYAYNADPEESGISGDAIFWFLTDTLENGESISIEFDAKVISNGTNVNRANVTAQECQIGRKYSEDTATVYAIEILDPLSAEAGGPYSGYMGETIQFTGTATGGKSPYTYNWDLDNDGEYDDATGSTVSKSWETVGTYTIGLKVIDNIGKNDTDTSQVTVSIRNTKPNKPEKPTGKLQGKKGIEYTYSTRTVDPEGDQVRYEWDWGDGTTSGWVGPYDSDVTVEAKNTWGEEGAYEIKVRAKDTSGLISDWSDPLPISMPYNKRSISLFAQILERLMERFPLLELILSLPIFII